LHGRGGTLQYVKIENSSELQHRADSPSSPQGTTAIKKGLTWWTATHPPPKRPNASLRAKSDELVGQRQNGEIYLTESELLIESTPD
jgi:hypothetical protein